jgi:hypothetical protein
MGSRKKNSLHICDWKHIARPKIYGGWGLWNILDFSKSMATNSI